MIKKTALLLIRFYQVGISPLFPSCCRFTPTCSEYAKIAIERFGVLQGGKLALKRLSKCRPHSDYGYDPVPEKL
nr:membrane protein insertion efficiency factor YidD [Phoenicibacter congonensis]